MSLQLEIVTPEARVYESEIDSVKLPTTTGEIGILPGHIPLVTEVQAGEITVEKSGSSESLAVSKGFAQCVGNKVSILAENAINVEEIDEESVIAAQKRAEEALKSATEMTQEEIDHLETTVQFAKTQLLVRQKRKF